MSNTIISPNMNLSIPVTGVDTGPDWANNLNACLSIIDGHNHASGSGVQITPSGLNINSDLSFLSNNATLLRSVRFSAQGSPLALGTDLGCLYESGVDLYYNDGVGNQVRITQSGGVAGSPGSIANLSSPASATYVSADSTFVWQSDASTPANNDGASLILRNLTANSKGLTLSPPNAMASDYSIVLPALPGAASVLSMDASGNIAANANNVIVGANITANTITRSKLAAVGQQVSSSCGFYQTTSTSYASAITNLSVTITTSGRPVVLFCQADANGSGFTSYFTSQTTASTLALYIPGSGTPLAEIGVNIGPSFMPPSIIYYLDTPAAGTYTYEVAMRVNAGGGTGTANALVLVAYEL